MSAQWWSFAALMLIVPALAGCVEEPTAPAPEEPPVGDVEWIVPTPEKVDAAKMLANHKAFVKSFPNRVANHPDHKGARDFMANEFNESGLIVLRQPFEKGIQQENICGIAMGHQEPAVWVVVGAHYDTTTSDGIFLDEPAPSHAVSEGAYDDGSGTRMVIEMAKSYAKIRPYYSVLFCAFDGEERGLQGSGHVFASMGEGGNNEEFPYPVDYVRAMLDLDMYGICWPVSVPIAYDQNDAELYKRMDAARKELQIPDDMWVEAALQLGTSDFGHWKKAGIPTVFYISDFENMGAPRGAPQQPATPGTPTGAYPFWHQVDNYETMQSMAGGAESLQAGFQTGVDLAMATLAAMALDPTIKLKVAE